MLGAYFDASGLDDKSPCVVIAGFVAHSDKWAWFENEWKILLEEHGLEYAHGRKLRHLLGRKYVQFHFEVNFLLKKTVVIAPAVIARHKTYKAVFPNNTISNKDSIYGLCFRSVMVQVLDYAVRKFPGETVAFIVESGDAEIGAAQNMAQRQIAASIVYEDMKLIYPIETFTIADKRNFAALQAADMHAYAILQNEKSKSNKKKHEYHGIINSLLNDVLVDHFHLNREMIADQKRIALGKFLYEETREKILEEVRRRADSIRRGAKTNH